jgi:hypothetical protein
MEGTKKIGKESKTVETFFLSFKPLVKKMSNLRNNRKGNQLKINGICNWTSNHPGNPISGPFSFHARRRNAKRKTMQWRQTLPTGGL